MSISDNCKLHIQSNIDNINSITNMLNNIEVDKKLSTVNFLRMIVDLSESLENIIILKNNITVLRYFLVEYFTFAYKDNIDKLNFKDISKTDFLNFVKKIRKYNELTQEQIDTLIVFADNFKLLKLNVMDLEFCEKLNKKLTSNIKKSRDSGKYPIESSVPEGKELASLSVISKKMGDRDSSKPTNDNSDLSSLKKKFGVVDDSDGVHSMPPRISKELDYSDVYDSDVYDGYLEKPTRQSAHANPTAFINPLARKRRDSIKVIDEGIQDTTEYAMIELHPENTLDSDNDNNDSKSITKDLRKVKELVENKIGRAHV